MSFQPPDPESNHCELVDGTYDHDMHFTDYDPSVGMNGCWVCKLCGWVDEKRNDLPSDDDDWT